jgi:hypothetical protein
VADVLFGDYNPAESCRLPSRVQPDICLLFTTTSLRRAGAIYSTKCRRFLRSATAEPFEIRFPECAAGEKEDQATGSTRVLVDVINTGKRAGSE